MHDPWCPANIQVTIDSDIKKFILGGATCLERVYLGGVSSLERASQRTRDESSEEADRSEDTYLSPNCTLEKYIM